MRRNPGNPRRVSTPEKWLFYERHGVPESSTRYNGKKRGREKYSKKWKYGSYPVALANAIALAAAVGYLGDFADVFQTRSRDQVQWPVAVKERSRTTAALLAVIDDAYVRAFIK